MGAKAFSWKQINELGFQWWQNFSIASVRAKWLAINQLRHSGIKFKLHCHSFRVASHSSRVTSIRGGLTKGQLDCC